ncbi:MAG TPA: hypothetical protein VFZ61_13420 [Polyangiales bacterium]
MNNYTITSIAALLLAGAACSSDSDGNPPYDAGGSTVIPGDGSIGVGPDTGTTAGGGVPGGSSFDGGASTGGGVSDGGSVGAGMDGGSTGGGAADSGSDGGMDAGSATDGGDAAPGSDAGSDASATDASATDAGDSAVGNDGGGFEGCVQRLKSKCSYVEKETACASQMTAKIPLSDGGVIGDLELKGGPYGAYVEWNEGARFATADNFLELTCDLVASSFGEPASVTQDVLDLRGQDLKLYTVFRPACMRDGETYPVITWGNGTCGQTGGYGSLLANLASHGFVVVAANSRWTNGDEKVMLRALDFAKAANEDPSHVLYKRLNLDKVGAMGHSQGSGATVAASTDPRIDALILWNGGTAGSNVKPFLSVSGDRDIGDPTVAAVRDGANAATQPGAWLFYHQVPVTGGNFTGHLTLMMQPERVTEATVAWWKYMLKGDQEAKKAFIGSDCGLCNKKDQFEFGLNGKPLP